MRCRSVGRPARAVTRPLRNEASRGRWRASGRKTTRSSEDPVAPDDGPSGRALGALRVLEGDLASAQHAYLNAPGAPTSRRRPPLDGQPSADPLQDAGVRATLHEALGDVALAGGDGATATRHYDTALLLLTPARGSRSTPAREALARLSLLRARRAQAQGEQEAALKGFEQARAQAGAAGSQDLGDGVARDRGGAPGARPDRRGADGAREGAGAGAGKLGDDHRRGGVAGRPEGAGDVGHRERSGALRGAAPRGHCWRQ